jgi:hypothetical protein
MITILTSSQNPKKTPGPDSLSDGAHVVSAKKIMV